MPVVTILVMVICFFVYLAQYRNEGMINRHAEQVCGQMANNSPGGYEGAGLQSSKKLVN